MGIPNFNKPFSNSTKSQKQRNSKSATANKKSKQPAKARKSTAKSLITPKADARKRAPKSKKLARGGVEYGHQRFRNESLEADTSMDDAPLPPPTPSKSAPFQRSQRPRPVPLKPQNLMRTIPLKAATWARPKMRFSKPVVRDGVKKYCEWLFPFGTFYFAGLIALILGFLLASYPVSFMPSLQFGFAVCGLLGTEGSSKPKTIVLLWALCPLRLNRED